MGEARRLRADVERELRGAKTSLEGQIKRPIVGRDAELNLKRATKYIQRLDRAKLEIDATIAALTTQQGQVDRTVDLRYTLLKLPDAFLCEVS